MSKFGYSKKEVDKLKESVNEGRFDKDLDKIQSAVENASSFMNIGSELKKLGIKYDFSTGMMPIYRIKISGNTVGIVNKRYTDGAEREVGDVAIGLLENIRVNESSKPKVVTKKEWDRLHSDFKSIRNGQAYMMYMDKASGATIYGPVTIKESVKEAKMSDALLVADQLVNGVDEGHLDKREFISHLSKETKFGKNELGKVFDAWDKLNFREKDDLGFSNKEMLKWLTQYGINESVKENKIHIDNRMVDQIKQSVKMGYDTIVVGKITATKRGVMLVNDKYQVRGTYPLEAKDAIEKIIKSVK